MAQLLDPAHPVLRTQDGVISRSQLLACGVTAEAVRWNAGRHWRVLLPGVYLPTRALPTIRQRQVAALLWAGATSCLASTTAARVHGIRAADPGLQVRLLVPAPNGSRANTFADVRRTLLADPFIAYRGPLRLSCPARACVDAALLSRSGATRSAILIEAVQRAVSSVDDRAEWVHRLRTRDAALVRPALNDAASGAWSIPEAELLDLVSRSAVLPEPWANPHLDDVDGLPLLTPDVRFDDVALAVMVHSYAHHSQGDHWDATVERDAGLVSAGIVVAGVTPRRLRSDPTGVLRRIERTYAAAAVRLRPDVVATPRHLTPPRPDLMRPRPVTAATAARVG